MEKQPILTVCFKCIYKDVYELKYATVLWNLVNWFNNEIMRCNNNAFAFNRMIGYNTAFYDINTKDWYWDEVNSQSATCYIKFGEQHYNYIQPLRPRNVSFVSIKNNEVIIPI